MTEASVREGSCRNMTSRKHSPLPWSHVEGGLLLRSMFSSSEAKYFLRVFEVERSRTVMVQRCGKVMHVTGTRFLAASDAHLAH